MLSKIVVVANLLMLAKGFIEVPPFKLSHLSKNVLNSVNRRSFHSQPLPITLFEGLYTDFRVYLAR
eukprot:Ihof_evm2s510 gene=Ihof_evmTU2s510